MVWSRISGVWRKQRVGSLPVVSWCCWHHDLLIMAGLAQNIQACPHPQSHLAPRLEMEPCCLHSILSALDHMSLQDELRILISWCKFVRETYHLKSQIFLLLISPVLFNSIFNSLHNIFAEIVNPTSYATITNRFQSLLSCAIVKLQIPGCDKPNQTQGKVLESNSHLLS